MPQQKKKPAASKSAPKKSSSTKAPMPQMPQKSPKRREIGAIICFALGVFSFIGYFPNDGLFIAFFANLTKGLVGWGFFLLPPALVVAAVILAFHRGRPVRFRVTCTLLIPVVAGALYQLFFSKGEYTLSFSVIGTLWKDGLSVINGGVFGGYLSLLFKTLFSTVGAAIVFIILLVFLTMSMMNLTISTIVQRYKERERIEYELEPEPEPMPVRRPKRRPEPMDAPQETIKESKKDDESAAKALRHSIDIPLDDPIAERKKAPSLFKKNSSVTTPGDFIRGDVDPATGEVLDYHQEDEPKKPIPIEDIPIENIIITEPEPTPAPVPVATQEINSVKKPPVKIEPVEIEIKPAEEVKSTYVFPPISLLATPKNIGHEGGKEEMRLNKERLESTLKSFGVSTTISAITRGPSVTLYEMELEAGVKLNKLTNLSDDIALSLGASGVRIAAIPGKVATVGIEVPNKQISTVYLSEIVESREFKASSSKLTFAIGKNIQGDAIIGNISKLPHMLVAGTTGSGKSVCLNSLILSLLYKANPDELKFIMIDPKMVEFKIYNGIPHLLIPVVTEAKKAAGALQWAVTEMMKRYRLFSEIGARDLETYNELAKKDENPDVFPIPQIVIVIDELADLMMIAAKEVEESICRVAQMGRAAGVHLVIATQSPRADVITGLMKANIPSRIALKVSSSLESRIILDSGGSADKLVGNGDMLYAPIGSSKPLRVQGTWVSDEEREQIIEHIKKDSQPNYADDVIDQIERSAAEKEKPDKKEAPAADDCDELFPQAVEVILESGQASVSMLQRRLKLGYSRAARLVDQMEERGIVGPFEGSKPRQLLVTRAQWQEMQYIQGTAPIERIAEEPAPPVPAPPQTPAPEQFSSDPEQNMFSADDLFDE